MLKHFFSLIMYLTYFSHPPLCTAAGSQCWKQNENVKTKTKACLRLVLSYEHGLRPQDWLLGCSSFSLCLWPVTGSTVLPSVSWWSMHVNICKSFVIKIWRKSVFVSLWHILYQVPFWMSAFNVLECYFTVRKGIRPAKISLQQSARVCYSAAGLTHLNKG